MVRTITGPQPVRVLWRRLDAAYADPLELDAALARWARRAWSARCAPGNLTMANALGSGVLETRALLAFLPTHRPPAAGRAAAAAQYRHLVVRPARRAAIMCKANAERMMIGPALSTSLPFEIDATTALGGAFRGTARESVDAMAGRGRRQPGRAGGGDAVDHAGLVRGQAGAAADDGAGLCRPHRATAGGDAGRLCADRQDRRCDRAGDAQRRLGGRCLDRRRPAGGARQPDPRTACGPSSRRSPAPLPSRAADNLYWLGRYIERAEGVMRQMRSLSPARGRGRRDRLAAAEILRRPARRAGDRRRGAGAAADPEPARRRRGLRRQGARPVLDRRLDGAARPAEDLPLDVRHGAGGRRRGAGDVGAAAQDRRLHRPGAREHVPLLGLALPVDRPGAGARRPDVLDARARWPSPPPRPRAPSTSPSSWAIR